MIVIYNTRPCWLASYGKSLTACESGPLEAVETCQGSRQEGILLALDVEGSHPPLRISLPSCRWWKAACFCPPRGAVPLVEAAGLSTAVREVPENAVTMFFLPISTSLPVRLTKRRGLREAYRRALPLRESETSVVGASSFVVPAGAAQNAQSKSTGGAQEALQESMRFACGQARRRPRQWLRANASTPFFQFSATSGLSALSLAEVYS